MNTVNKWLALVLASAAMCAGAQAQGTAPKKDGAELSDAERARRDASKVFRFIKFHAVRSAPAAQGNAGGTVAAVAPSRPLDKPAEKGSDPAAPQGTQVASASPNPSPSPAAPAPAAGLNEPDPAALVAAEPTASGGALAAAAVAVTAPAAPVVDATPAAKPAPEAEELVELALLHHVQPELPARQLAHVRNGSVMVQFTVQPDGKTDQVFARPGAQLRLAQAAIKAVQQWRFSPIGEAREVMVEVAFNFD